MNTHLQPHPVDTILERLLFIKPELGAPLPRTGLKTPLLISAVRCIAQYLVLPFVLPFVGVIGGVPAWLGLACNIVAFASLVVSLRRLWRVRHSRRFSYLPLAMLILFALAVFTIADLQALFAPGRIS
jgi:ABC-type iron transport system FetAB permease component